VYDKKLYKPRIIDEQIKEYLMLFGAICIEVPKWWYLDIKLSFKKYYYAWRPCRKFPKQRIS